MIQRGRSQKKKSIIQKAIKSSKAPIVNTYFMEKLTTKKNERYKMYNEKNPDSIIQKNIKPR